MSCLFHFGRRSRSRAARSNRQCYLCKTQDDLLNNLCIMTVLWEFNDLSILKSIFHGDGCLISCNHANISITCHRISVYGINLLPAGCCTLSVPLLMASPVSAACRSFGEPASGCFQMTIGTNSIFPAPAPVVAEPPRGALAEKLKPIASALFAGGALALVEFAEGQISPEDAPSSSTTVVSIDVIAQICAFTYSSNLDSLRPQQMWGPQLRLRRRWMPSWLRLKERLETKALQKLVGIEKLRISECASEYLNAGKRWEGAYRPGNASHLCPTGAWPLTT